MHPRNEKKHDNCQVCIKWKLFRGASTITPGLFCREHDKLLRWLPWNTAQVLIAAGVPELSYRNEHGN